MKLRRLHSGFTLAEIMVSIAVGAIAIAAAYSGIISIQRCVLAGEEFGADKAEQTRLSDYLAMDLRRALTIQGPVNNTILTLTLPPYYDGSGKPNTPAVIKGVDNAYVVSYGATPVTVVYRKFKATITRTEDNGTPLVVANNVEDFDCLVDGIGVDKTVTTKVIFTPSLQTHGTTSAATRAATTVYNTVRLRNKS
jgi:prepilin-type N-terminal cleavage/methylation domain-containing protein